MLFSPLYQGAILLTKALCINKVKLMFNQKNIDKEVLIETLGYMIDYTKMMAARTEKQRCVYEEKYEEANVWREEEGKLSSRLPTIKDIKELIDKI